jgi:asparagine synthase (glutamine-hydrolysing)
MCGIAGFLNYDFNHSFFDEVNTIQYHRGPDAQDSFRHENIQLYHQRLSIIDISEAANQPFKKDKYIIIFNGEIYNYKSLRQTLIEEKGILFRTSSDTEVLLELYRSKGPNCLNDLQGMFAFAIYNLESRELFLARDHFGIKPLFYYSNSRQFAFASELKTLIKAPGIKKDINYLSLTSSLNYLWLPGNATMFNGINKLPPGSFAVITNEGEMALKSYYEPPQTTVDYSEADAIAELDEILCNSVSRHLEADVPVSAFLSGGLDSSLLSVLAKREQPLSTYSIAISRDDKRIEQMPDDAKYAREVANKYGMDHHEILINPAVAEELPHMVYHLDEPIGDPAAINTYLISKAARENGVKVLLSGMGADEIFFGYRRQMATLEAMKYQKMPGLFKGLVGNITNMLPVRIGNKGIKTTRWAKRFLSFANLPPSEAYQRSYSYYDKASLINLLTNDATNDIDEMYLAHQRIFDRGFEDDLINKMCYTDVQYFMQGLNLTYTDRASMAASVEVRVPFIDKKVVDFALSIPGPLKYKHRKQKYLLKKVAEKYLPKNIIYRPKASFGAPIRSWISGALEPMVNDLLSSDSISNRGLFNPNEIRDLIKSNKEGKADNAYQIYQLLTTELWFREFVD